MKPDLRPMLATLTDKPFDDPDWIFETKWDGFRLVAEIKDGSVALYSRNLIDLSSKYPSVCAALRKVNGFAVIDGELVALDAHGRSRFQLLQNAEREKVRLRYCVFDLLYLNDQDLREHPLIKRKEMLKKVLPKDPLLQYSAHVWDKGIAAFKRAARAGEEGVMAKLATSHYYSGQRTRDFLKVKASLGQEVVIVGFTAPRRSRQYFGSLLLAVREGKEWRYVGRAGSGFDRESLKSLHAQLVPLITDSRPIAEKGQHHLGQAEARRRGEVHRMDLEGRDAPSRLPRAPRRQKGDRRDQGDPKAGRSSRPLIEVKDCDAALS
jgi:bifunctional non-homologous end joining protein LigD